MVLTITPTRNMVRKVRFELTRPFGHHGLSMTRLPFRHMRVWWAGLDLNQQRFQCHGFTDRLLQPFAYLPIWLQGRDSDPHMTVYEAGVLPVDYPAV